MNVAIIVAAGQGTRIGGEQPKQFRDLVGVPIIIHTLRRFEQCATIGEIIVVLPSAEVKCFNTLASKYRLRKIARITPGGETRMESVWRGLQHVRAISEIVAVHDGVRPLVSPGEIDKTVRAAQTNGAAILVSPATDTIKEVNNGQVVQTFARKNLRHALTPQCFRQELIRKAYEKGIADKIDATDDSVLVELLGEPVTVIEGDIRNIKITRPEDLILAEVLMRDFEN
jgi:2-C-methyl-D-erythritol 4-phosphate cytidylyltransferase